LTRTESWLRENWDAMIPVGLLVVYVLVVLVGDNSMGWF
jgi:hypothetical protein